MIRLTHRPLTGLLPVLLAALAAGACGGDTARVELPWTPDGVWAGVVDGLYQGEPTTDTLQLNMLRGNVYTTTLPDVFRVRVFGVWSWADFNGDFAGDWLVGRDDAAATDGGCPAELDQCSVIIQLLPSRPEAVCAENAQNNTVEPIEIGGWFPDADTIVAASLQGTFRDPQLEPPPCTGGVIVSFSTAVNLVRRQ